MSDIVLQSILPSDSFQAVQFDTEHSNVDTADTIQSNPHQFICLFIFPMNSQFNWNQLCNQLSFVVPAHNPNITQPQHVHCINEQYCIYEINATDYSHINVLFPHSTNTQLDNTKAIQRCFHILQSQHGVNHNSKNKHGSVPSGHPAFEPPVQPSTLHMPYRPFGYIDGLPQNQHHNKPPNHNTHNVDVRNGIGFIQRSFEQNNGRLNESTATATSTTPIKNEPISAGKSHRKHKHGITEDNSKSVKKHKKHKKHHTDD